jgi:glycosyltransferase involved in cell wall biosynthesis
MANRSFRITLLTNIPAPYRVATWNHLDRLTGGDAKVLFISPAEYRRKWAVPAELMAFDWGFLSCGGEPNRLSAQAVSAAGMLLHLVRRRPRTVVCGGYDSVAAWVSFCWCKLFGQRFVLWLESNARDRREPGRIKRRLKKWIVSKADGIAAAGSATVDYVSTLGAHRSRIFLAPFGGDVEMFTRRSGSVDADREKRALGFPPHLVLYSGRLVRAKGVFVLLEAFSQVASELPDAGLLIVGHGPEQQAMRRLAEQLQLRRVFFLGPQPYERMPYYYALADVLVLPTFSDPWGFVVNEAFACGVPAIVSRVAGACDDLIVEGETGFAISSGNPAELAERLLRILKNPELRAHLSKGCRLHIRRYSAEACAEGLLAAAQGDRNEVRN